MLIEPKHFEDQWENLGTNLLKIRFARGLSQANLAARCKLRQKDISLIENGKWQPSLRTLTNLAKQLDVPLQYFINGFNQSDHHVNSLTLELRQLGIVDLNSVNALVPGAFREKEQVVALSLQGDAPDPRVIDALPYVLLRNEWSAELFVAYLKRYDQRALYRCAWLIDIAQTIRDDVSEPGQRFIESSFSKVLEQAQKPVEPDSLGYPILNSAVVPPVHRRWNINYATDVRGFLQRAKTLQELSTHVHKQRPRKS